MRWRALFHFRLPALMCGLPTGSRAKESNDYDPKQWLKTSFICISQLAQALSCNRGTRTNTWLLTAVEEDNVKILFSCCVVGSWALCTLSKRPKRKINQSILIPVMHLTPIILYLLSWWSNIQVKTGLKVSVCLPHLGMAVDSPILDYQSLSRVHHTTPLWNFSLSSPCSPQRSPVPSVKRDPV